MKTTPEELSVATSLKENGWALVDADLETYSRRAIEGWNRFLAEPQEYKDSWTIPSKASQGPDNGYITRNGNSHDFKQFFHYRDYLPMLLEERGVDYTRHKQWILDCHRLHFECRHLAFRHSTDLDKLVPGAYFGTLMQDVFAEHRHVLRFLSYTDEPSSGKTLAKGHFDRNLFTFHVWENIPGLEVIQPDGTQFSYTAQPGKILMFPGKKAYLYSDGVIPQSKHFVAGRGNEDASVRRQSIVSFWHIDYKIPEES